jgi:hypothetical protein
MPTTFADSNTGDALAELSTIMTAIFSPDPLYNMSTFRHLTLDASKIINLSSNVAGALVSVSNNDLSNKELFQSFNDKLKEYYLSMAQLISTTHISEDAGDAFFEYTDRVWAKLDALNSELQLLTTPGSTHSPERFKDLCGNTDIASPLAVLNYMKARLHTVCFAIHTDLIDKTKEQANSIVASLKAKVETIELSEIKTLHQAKHDLIAHLIPFGQVVSKISDEIRIKIRKHDPFPNLKSALEFLIDTRTAILKRQMYASKSCLIDAVAKVEDFKYSPVMNFTKLIHADLARAQMFAGYCSAYLYPSSSENKQNYENSATLSVQETVNYMADHVDVVLENYWDPNYAIVEKVAFSHFKSVLSPVSKMGPAAKLLQHDLNLYGNVQYRHEVHVVERIDKSSVKSIHCPEHSCKFFCFDHYYVTVTRFTVNLVRDDTVLHFVNKWIDAHEQQIRQTILENTQNSDLDYLVKLIETVMQTKFSNSNFRGIGIGYSWLKDNEKPRLYTAVGAEKQSKPSSFRELVIVYDSPWYALGWYKTKHVVYFLF